MAFQKIVNYNIPGGLGLSESDLSSMFENKANDSKK